MHDIEKFEREMREMMRKDGLPMGFVVVATSPSDTGELN